jgi:hypothetical protein
MVSRRILYQRQVFDIRQKITPVKIYEDYIHLHGNKYEEVFVCIVEADDTKHQSKKCRDLYSCFIWLSNLLDGRPTKFHGYDLQAEKTRRAGASAILSEGAEYFVISYLMLNFGLICSQASRAMPGYDVLVAHPSVSDKTAKVQVKFRSSLASPNGIKSKERAIDVNSLDFDFLVVVSDPRIFKEDISFEKVTRSGNASFMATSYCWSKEKIMHRHPSCWIMSRDCIVFGKPYLTDDCYNAWEKIPAYFHAAIQPLDLPSLANQK